MWILDDVQLQSCWWRPRFEKFCRTFWKTGIGISRKFFNTCHYWHFQLIKIAMARNKRNKWLSCTPSRGDKNVDWDIDWRNLAGTSADTQVWVARKNNPVLTLRLFPCIRIWMHEPISEILLLEDALHFGNCRLRHWWNGFSRYYEKYLGTMEPCLEY